MKSLEDFDSVAVVGEHGKNSHVKMQVKTVYCCVNFLISHWMINVSNWSSVPLFILCKLERILAELLSLFGKRIFYRVAVYAAATGDFNASCLLLWFVGSGKYDFFSLETFFWRLFDSCNFILKYQKVTKLLQACYIERRLMRTQLQKVDDVKRVMKEEDWGGSAMLLCLESLWKEIKLIEKIIFYCHHWQKDS